MTDMSFLDTNILVWAVDYSDTRKQTLASELLRNLDHEFSISTQVMVEYCNVRTRTMGAGPSIVRNQLELMRQGEVVTFREETVLEAVDLSVLHQISFWDAAILAAAKQARCSVLFTEDLNHGQVIGGVIVHNPFLKD